MLRLHRRYDIGRPVGTLPTTNKASELSLLDIPECYEGRLDIAPHSYDPLMTYDFALDDLGYTIPLQIKASVLRIGMYRFGILGVYTSASCNLLLIILVGI
jgi:hypothetical protein